MAEKWLVPIDLAQSELRNAVIQNLGADPTSPAPINGQVWYLTTGGHDVRARVNGANVSLLPTSLLSSANTWTANQTVNANILGNGTIALTGAGASSVGGTFTGTALIASGLTGSVAASRYVGATASGAPTTGAHLVGDFVVAQDGHMFVCTVAGTPGTWVDVGGSGFPGYGAVTAQTAFGAASANGVATTVSRSDHAHGTPTHVGTDHAAISLSSLSAPTADLSIGSHKLTNVTDGVAASDAATVGQVQGLIATGTNKTAVRIATTANDTLSGLAARDGVTPVAGDRVLVKAQTTASANGIYVAAAGAWTRATDADIDAEVKGGLSVWVNEGTVNADTRWVLTTNDPITLGTTSLTFVQDFAASATTAGAGLTASGGVLAVGAGTGISVAADSVGIDTAVVARKFTQLVGTGAATSIAVTHNLGNQNVHTQLFDASTNAMVHCDVTNTDANTVTLGFTTAPASNAYRVVIVG